VCFYLKSPEDEEVGPPGLGKDHIQGFSMAVEYCCDVEAEEVLDIKGTIIEAIGAEYVSIQVDNEYEEGGLVTPEDPDGIDGCELIIGVLVDALPPFDGQTIPPTDTFTRIGCVPFKVKETAPCGGPCCDIVFKDGVDGDGKIPIYNLISVENFERSVQTIPCKICIEDKEKFFRGDCNFSGDSGTDGSLAVNIADAAAVVSYLFLPGTYKFIPPCLDACDCNDDGRIDLADVVCILRYLFQDNKMPPDPGPGYREVPGGVEHTPAGTDPTADMLDCAAGAGCDGA